MNQLNVILNGKHLLGNQGETILELAQRHGVEIPSLCHDPRLEPFTSCFLCVVEVDKMRGLQPACSTKLAEGLTVSTDTPKVRKARKTALDLLVSNHYADCMAPCKERCPANVDVQGYISLIDKGLYSEAIELIKQVNPLPAICGRVCVRPCEVACRRNLMDEGSAVGIDYLKRFAADFDLRSATKFTAKVAPTTGKKVAVIGAGPGGLSVAYFLQQKGHQADIYEASPYAGGMLRYGIPPYRLPNELIDKEVACITEIGVNIFYNQRLGDNLSYKTLQNQYDSVILTIGSQKGTKVGCEGDDAENVFSGIDFLRNMELTKQHYNFKGKKVATVGGGNTAMDCCRTALRCGAEKSYVIYRRTENEMPANKIEIHESKLEGVEYLLLTLPVKINKNEQQQVKSITCQRMELGEPDGSGRRRPVPVPNSDFDLEVDFVLAAIGQKTDVNFINDINENSSEKKLTITKWGDIEANTKTLQTNIPSFFAAGDGVTGPATLIEAIAQAKIASQSCHQFLMGMPLESAPKEFLSKKDNFRQQTLDEYIQKYGSQTREEMPVLEPNKRLNFNEVELGYDEPAARHETHRCLECGCVEYFTCDLKRYCSEYQSEQKHFEGDFREYPVDFSHPFIEIDNNKCILCGRCIRICREVVNANALGFVNRGFDTLVAPSLGKSLTETACESCGLCISTCPTGAITENVDFKPGPVLMEKFDTVCNYCSVGCKITVHHKKGFVMKVTGAKGDVNKDGNICRYAKFGYQYMNDNSRLQTPMLKRNGKFVPITFAEANGLIVKKIKAVKADENAFFAGARLTNEEIYSIQKLARAAVKTNNISSFHYISSGGGYVYNAEANVPFEQISGASKIYLLGSELNRDNAVVDFMVQNTKCKKNITVELFTAHENSAMSHKVNAVHKITSFYHFVKAVNHYLLSNQLENKEFIQEHGKDYESYKIKLLSENFDELLSKSGVCCQGTVINFAHEYRKQPNVIIVFSEKEVSANTSFELVNLALLTGKLGKPFNGIVALKEKNNSQGLFEMGSFAEIGVGNQPIESQFDTMKSVWNNENLNTQFTENQYELLEQGKLKNIFIFGEDPVGCAVNHKEFSELMQMADFKVVSDYFMTETAQLADLILPASFPFEIGGSFTNTQKTIQHFDAVSNSFPKKLEKVFLEQLADIQNVLGVNSSANVSEINEEANKYSKSSNENLIHNFNYTDKDIFHRRFLHGCDNLVKRFDEFFMKKF